MSKIRRRRPDGVSQTDTLKLHPSLAQYFPGSGNQCATPMAGFRIQAIFDVCSQRWIHFQLGASKDSDQKDSALVLDYLQAGDLVIRDLGYAVLRVWRQIIGKGAYFLSRWRNDLKLFDPRTNQPVDLLALLKSIPIFVPCSSWWAFKNAYHYA